MSRYLTKSKFLLGLDCPAKLYYTKKEQYPDKTSDNEFLDALAKGGFQVGALAKCYFPGGHDIETLDYDQSVSETNELLKLDEVVIFEAAFQFDKFFVRVDILEKVGDRVNLTEVKSKSFDGNSSLDMRNRSGYISTNWKPYVYDVAFQKYVVARAKPGWGISSFLMLADKNKTASIEGLNQKFLLREQADERTFVDLVGDVSKEALGNEILIKVNVDDLCEMIYERRDSKDPLPKPFGEYCLYLADHYWADEKISIPVHKDCGNCQFRTTLEEGKSGKISGFKECWSEQLGWTEQDFDKALIFDIWNFRRKPALIEDGIFHMDHVKPEHIVENANDTTTPLSTQARQWLQIKRTRDGLTHPFIDRVK